MKECDCIPVDNAEPQTKRTQSKMTPECALELLKQGNDRFFNKLMLRRDLKWQVEVTSCGQAPFAIILSCIDSRVASDLIFDQGIGDFFNARVAGNFVNNDILGGMEFAYSSGVRLVMVLGHTRCGAIDAAIASCGKEAPAEKAACSHIGPMVANLCPAVEQTPRLGEENDTDYHNRVVKRNVELNMEKIRKESECLRKAEENGEIAIVGGVYDVCSGRDTFFEYPRVEA